MTQESMRNDDRTAVEKAIALLAAFGRDSQVGLGVSELARRTKMSKSTAFRVLAMLEREGAVERAGTAYRVGRLIRTLGAPASRSAHGFLREVLTPFLADLYVATRMTVHLAVLEGTDAVYLNKLHGHDGVPSPSRIGGRIPAHCTAVGKALVAHNPGAVDRLLQSDLHAWTSNTITRPEDLIRELADVRKHGVAYDRGEVYAGLNCVAVAVKGLDGSPIAAFSISGADRGFNLETHTFALRRASHAAARALLTVGQRATG